MQEVQDAGMIDPRERSREFEGIPVDEVEIKKLPKKVRRASALIKRQLGDQSTDS